VAKERIPCGWSVAVVLVALHALALHALALRAAAQEAAPLALAPEHALVLRVSPPLAPHVDEVRAILALRTGVPVSVGEPIPRGAPDLVGEGEIGVDLTDARSTEQVLAGVPEEASRLRIVLGGPGRITYATELAHTTAAPISARAIALAILALRDTAMVGPGDLDAPRDPDAPAYVYRPPPDGPLGPPRRIEPEARPMIYFRLLVGLSTARTTVLVGPGVGVGLCLRDDCVAIEGDLPLLPEERRAVDGALVQYRPVTLGLRVQLRPIRIDRVTLGVSAGPMIRVGNARIDASGVTQTVTSFGVRGTLELAWEFVDRFEWVLEGGVDVSVNPARFLRGMEAVLLEDVVTAWGVTSLRLRP
jgi:hypothetical protein